MMWRVLPIFLVLHFLGMAVTWGVIDKYGHCSDYDLSNYQQRCGALAGVGVWEFEIVVFAVERVLP